MDVFHICLQVLIFIPLVETGRTFQLRLSENRYPYFGRVEVNMDDGYGWGTVCDDMWDDTDAIVVCKSLGFTYGKAVATSSFGNGNGKIHMDDVNCNGQETSLIYCRFNKTSDCDHTEDAGVICFTNNLRSTAGTNEISLIHTVAYCIFGVTIMILAVVIVIVVLCCRKHKNNGQVPVDLPALSWRTVAEQDRIQHATSSTNNEDEHQYEDLMKSKGV